MEGEFITLEAFAPLNTAAQNWTRETADKVKKSLDSKVTHYSDNLINSFKGRLLLDSGIASKISYKFLRYGVFVQKGVGRGWPIESIKSNTSIINSSGKKRVPKDWFNSVLNDQLPKLADAVAANMADITVKNIQIR